MRIALVKKVDFHYARFALSAVLVLLLWGCQKSPADHMAAAMTAIEAKDPVSAVLHLKNAIANEPNNAEARLLLGAQELAAGDARAAVIDLRRARELKVAEDKVVPILAEAMVESGQSSVLLEQFGNLKLSSPSAMAQLSNVLALACLDLNNTDQAAKFVSAALAADPQSASAKLTRARVSLAKSDNAQAMREVDALVLESPQHDDAWAFKGTLHEVLPEQHEKAFAAFNKALAINPKQFQSLYSSVSLHMVRNDLKAARESLDRLVKVRPKNLNTLYLEARLNYLRGDYAEARPQFAFLLNVAPENVPTLLASGLNELKVGAPIQAEAQLARAVSLAPSNAAARYYLAQANLQLGRPEKASNTLATLIDLPTAQPEILVVAAQARLLQGDALGADQLYTRAAKFGSKDPSVRTALALAQVAKGASDAALRELQLISDSTDATDVDLRLISARLSRGELSEALKAIERVDQKKPQQPAGPELRGQVLVKQGDLAGARKAFEQALQRDKFYLPALSQLTNVDFQEGKIDQARKRLTDALTADPNNSPVLTLLASLSVRSGGSASEVQALLERATKADPLNLSAWLTLMLRHFNAGDIQAALNAGQSAGAFIKDNVQLMELTGRIQLKGGDVRQANSTFSNLIRVAPRSASGYMGLAAALVAAGELEPAAKTLQRLIEQDPKSVDAQRMAAEVATRRNLFKDALAIARNVQQQNPAQAVGFLMEGAVESSQGNTSAAVAAFSKGLDKANPGMLPNLVHALLLRDGKAAEAKQMEARWIKNHPKDVEFLAYLGDTDLAAKNLSAARALYEQVLSIDPKHAGALNNMAWALLQSKDPAAIAFVERALKVQPDRPEILDTLAQIHVSQKQYSKAVDALKLAINRATDTAPLRLSLARVYIEADEPANATVELEKLLALGKTAPQYAQARKLLAEARRR